MLIVGKFTWIAFSVWLDINILTNLNYGNIWIHHYSIKSSQSDGKIHLKKKNYWYMIYIMSLIYRYFHVHFSH